MMGGYGPMMGPGMMGSYGMMHGPGMMGGYGMMPGPGMMGGHPMMGPGFGRALWALNLDEAQRRQVRELRDEQRRKHWALAGSMHDEMEKLRDAWWTSGKRDRAAILAAYKRIGELRLQALENSLDALDRFERILTAEQREQLGRWGPAWMMDGTR
ncbi:MAG TPA: periplasmic heavy metal sensor [Alphaproteobacteria bacterium]|nr:periplasmic heavy metal sensor [Alphaproteobacteria bacterium]